MNDLENTTEIECLCAKANGPVFVTKNGNKKLVVMNINYYKETIGKMYESKMISD